VNEEFNLEAFHINESNSFHRVFDCEENELSKPFDSIFFPNIKDYEEYKQLRVREYKELKAEDKDITVFTDVRNIISSEKIYLINIIQEMKLYVSLLQVNKEPYLMKTLHETTIHKIY
jgi:hypothetical protein